MSTMDRKMGRHASGQAAAYLARPPERLVVEGYRLWSRTASARREHAWRQALLLYREALGPDDGPALAALLAGFAHALGDCAVCPLAMLRPGACALCRDEALIVALIAGIQHSDEAAVDHCLTGLARRERMVHLACRAGDFALGLKAAGAMLLPVPFPVIAGLSAGERSASTLH